MMVFMDIRKHVHVVTYSSIIKKEYEFVIYVPITRFSGGDLILFFHVSRW